MSAQPHLFDPDDEDRRDMYRRENPPTSKDAAHSVDLKGDRKLVLDTVARYEVYKPAGFTRAEIAELAILGGLDREGRPLRARIESIRRRVSDFNDVLEETGERQDGEALFRLKR